MFLLNEQRQTSKNKLEFELNKPEESFFLETPLKREKDK